MADPLLQLLPPLDISRVRLGDNDATADSLQVLWQAWNDFLQRRNQIGRVGAIQDAPVTDDLFVFFTPAVTTTFQTFADSSSISVIPMGDRIIELSVRVVGTLTTDDPGLTRFNMKLPFGMKAAFTNVRQFYSVGLVFNQTANYVAEVGIVWDDTFITITTMNGEVLVSGTTVLRFQFILSVER